MAAILVLVEVVVKVVVVVVVFIVFVVVSFPPPVPSSLQATDCTLSLYFSIKSVLHKSSDS